MVFWGTEVKPGRPYAQTFEEWRGQLHVTMATLGLGAATSKSVLQCNVGNKSPVLLCCLFPERKECVQLNLEFKEVKELIFSVIGPRSIHLSGFYEGPSRSPNEDSARDSFGLDIADTESDESDSDDEYGGSFINDGSLEMRLHSSEDESLDEKKQRREEPKPKKDKKKSRLRKSYQVSSESEEDPRSPALGISSGDEDMWALSTFVRSSKGKAKVKTPKKKTQNHDDENWPICKGEGAENEDGKEVEGEGAENEDEKEVDGEGAENEDGEEVEGEGAENEDEKEVDSEGAENEDGEEVEGEGPENEDGKEVGGEGAENEDGKEVEGEGAENEDEKEVEGEGAENEDGKEVEGEAKVGTIAEDRQTLMTTDLSESVHKDCERPMKKKRIENDCETAERPEKREKTVNSIEEGKEKQDEVKDEVTESKRKMKRNIKRREENSAAKAQSPVAKDVEDNKKTDAISRVQILQNGLTMEELKSGESDGMVAVAGKVVGVRYECKLKSSGRVLESNYVKFRLGARKVTEGWEDGLKGLRVGEKRRLTVPPGFVKVGEGKNVPHDSWLVYEVELIKIR